MPVTPFAEYRPDVMDLDQQLSQAIKNCLPRGDGYGPIKSLAGFTAALPAPCRGYYCALNTSSNTVVIFAATATKLYKLNNTTLAWTDVSQSGGSYTSVASSANWSFAQFNNLVLAVQANVNPQQFNVVSDSAFSDVSGSPPRAAYVSVINSFGVLSGLASNPNRVQWSGIGDLTNWTAGTNSSDYQDIADGGSVRGVVGGELGIIIMDSAIRTMTFSPGSDVIFNFFRVNKDIGCIAPYSIVNVGNTIFFLSAKGWVQTDSSGVATYIGQEKIDRTFLASYDAGNPQLLIGAADPQKPIVYWIYKTQGTSQTYADSGLAFNYVLGRWSPYAANAEYIASMSAPGLTLENLDALAPGALTITGAANNGSGLIRITVASTSTLATGNLKTISGVVGTTEANNTAANGWWKITVIDGTHFDLQGSAFVNAYTSGGIVGGSLDAMTTSFDSISTFANAAIAGSDTTHTIGFLTGPTMEATFETAEESGSGQRILVQGFAPITDAPSVYGSISYRENLNSARAYTPEVTMNAYGYCATMRSTRYARARLRIPSGTNWSYITGIRPDAKADGYA